MLTNCDTGPGSNANPPDPVPPVMILGDHFGYPGGIPHGVTSYFLQVLPALRALGIDLTVCFLRESHPAADVLRSQGIAPIFLGAKKWDPSVVSRVTTLARRHKVSIVHATGLKATLVARVAARQVGATTILHTHDLNEPRGPLGVLHKLAARPTDIGVCVSEAVRDLTVHKYHVLRDRVRVIHNGIRLNEICNVPPQTRAQVREDLQVEADQPVIAMVGRMHPVKGHREMLTMLPAITQSYPTAVLALVGDGPERAACEAIVGDLRLRDRVRFLGQRPDVPRLLAAADVLVMPSRSEGLPIAAVEALAAGLPVVAFDVGGLREVVTDDVTGRLVPAGDQDAFVQALVSIIRDPECRRRYGKQARLDSLRFGLEFHVSKLMACYREAAAL